MLCLCNNNINVLSFQHKNLSTVLWFAGFAFARRNIFIADEKGQRAVNDEGNVEPGVWFGFGSEPGLGEVPEDACAVGEFLGSVLLLLPEEDEGLDVELEGERVVWIVEVNVEGAT